VFVYATRIILHNCTA